MDRRREVRFEADAAVVVTVLGATKRRIAGRVADYSGRGICVRTSEPAPAGAAVRIDVSPALFLGEVTYCRREPSRPQTEGSTFRIGIEIEQMLGDTAELAALMRAVLGERPPAASEHLHALVHGHNQNHHEHQQESDPKCVGRSASP